MRESRFKPHPGTIRVEDSIDDGVMLRFSGTWPGSSSEAEFMLYFPSLEDLGTWLDGPVVGAVQEYRQRKENTPAKVIERALNGSYSDRAYQAEMIVKDLHEAGHIIIDAHIKSASARSFLATAASQGKIQVLPEVDDIEKTRWTHPKTGGVWSLDHWDMSDGLGDTWCWAGGWESDGTDYMWPLLRRRDLTAVDVRWDHVEANGYLVPSPAEKRG